jgi:hypothetical protein
MVAPVSSDPGDLLTDRLSPTTTRNGLSLSTK